MKKISFANLHHLHHTTFSYGDGFGTPLQHVQRAVELGYSAIAATEHGGLSSHFQLEKAAVKAGIKPIFGVEGYCGPVDEEHRGQFKNHLTILAANAEGYRNLDRLVTTSWQNYYYHPTISGDSLRDCRDGLVVLSGCSGSLLACSLLGGKGTPEPVDDAEGWIRAMLVVERFRNTFGDNYFLECQPFPELERVCAMNPAYEKMAKASNVRLVVTHDVHYPTMDDAEMQAVLHAVHRGKASVDDVLREWNYKVPLALPSSDAELRDRLVRTGLSKRAAIEAIENSAIIASNCNVTLPKAERLAYPIHDSDFKPWRLRAGMGGRPGWR
jgi:Zierdtviridae DNA polymerase